MAVIVENYLVNVIIVFIVQYYTVKENMCGLLILTGSQYFNNLSYHQAPLSWGFLFVGGWVDLGMTKTELKGKLLEFFSK